MVFFSHWKWEMWLGSGEHTVKEGIIEIDQERLVIIQLLLRMVNVTWRWRTHRQTRDNRD